MSSRRAGSGAVVLLLISASASTAQRATERPCQVVTPLKAVPGLREGSSLAISRQPPRRLFAMNDSGRAEVILLGLDGTPLGKVAITGARVVDWEDLTSGPCPGGLCLYIADIGDNARTRRSVSVYRLPEPREGDERATAVRFDAVYPDGPHDAEAMFAGPDGRLFLITKDPREAALYAFPARLDSGSTSRLARVASLELSRGRNPFVGITDAETSLDGRTVAVRTNDAVFFVPTASLVAGRMTEATTFSLRRLGEPKGEGVALGTNGEVFLIGEGGGGRQATGTFARLTCMATP